MTDDLLTLLREHDLPPRWDGRAAVWGGWHTGPDMFVCPPPKRECCTACGSLTESVMNFGYVATSESTTPDQIRDREDARLRLPPTLRHKFPTLALLELVAFRCPDCRQDVIHDRLTDLWWDLDHTDYGSDGSNPPSTPNAGLR